MTTQPHTCEFVEEYYGHRCKHCDVFYPHGFFEESEDDDEYEDEYWTCPTCGGEFWPGGTSCMCEDDEDNGYPDFYSDEDSF